MAYDFSVGGSDSVYLLTPQTDAAAVWAADYISADRSYLGNSIAVEYRYLQDLCVGILNDGLSIEKDGMEMYVQDDELYVREPLAVAA